ncbi:M20 family metallopeptidase (plasmid) [Photobacterium sp. DA100]|uniref:M20 aminoacylase family protein n=1 Tax=Photobacterium sp. DA100 TaxID=3027472 RepID=UPI002478C728|nr:M20 aminoacylase family protein [Photobacterium sp. DA100]WEM44905.1 M20 family metallopeptidase [Photobacterium sp. DA100]
MIEALQMNNEMFTAWRRDIHRHPELGFEESRTAHLVAEKLRAWGVDEVHTGIAKTGVVGVLKGRQASNRAIGLRADMDALPMDEANQFDYASCLQGKMHGCGHDGHTAILLAAAWYLSQQRNFSGTVYFIFQPAEEGLAGAKVMVEEGLFERFPCDRVYGLHNMPGIPQGKIWFREGPLLASSDRFVIEITGRGGHAAMPHMATDPTIVLSNIIMAAQTIISRNTSPLDAAVISFTDVHAGSGTHNVIPDHASLKGCLRAFDEHVRRESIERLGRLVGQVAASYGASAEFIVKPGSYPATVNDKGAVAVAKSAADAVVGCDSVDAKCLPLSGSEDFSFMLQQVPGCYVLVGNGSEGSRGGISVHNPSYDFNDEIIPVGASFFVEVIQQELAIK